MRQVEQGTALSPFFKTCFSASEVNSCLSVRQHFAFSMMDRIDHRKKLAFVGVVAAAFATCIGMAFFAQSPKRNSVELEQSWFGRNMSPAAARAFQLQLLNPGMREGEAKDPDDPWGYLVSFMQTIMRRPFDHVAARPILDRS
jgi:hypothetical protein